MKVLVVGSGGREHAIVWKISQSPKVSAVYCAPGNPGTAAIAENVAIAVDNVSAFVAFAKESGIDLVIVGPEYPLTLGLVDALQEAGVRVFGPTKEAARIEGSKSFAKEVMIGAEVPTAAYAAFDSDEPALAYLEDCSYPIVLKIDGLAAGKGVFICESLESATESIKAIYDKSPTERVVIEDYLLGKEASFIVATDGEEIVPLAASHDYKRIFDNDEGGNTGGMGTVSPTPNLTAEQEQWVLQHVMRPVIAQMKSLGCPFSGFLYAGLMIDPEGSIKVLEFNARLGDPETQVIVRRMQSDLFELLYSLAGGDGQNSAPDSSESAAVCVVLASQGYPESSSKGDVIEGIAEAEKIAGITVFHAGTALNQEGAIITAGGRVLNVTAVGKTVAEARELAYQGCEKISFAGMQCRKDIALER